MPVAENLKKIKAALPAGVTLVAVSKTHPVEKILEAYNAGQRIFGENKVQEMVSKWEQLPKDIEWHLIGHLQTNKVKYIAPFVSLIHSVDSWKLLKEINKQAEKNNRIINCLLQIYIAKEETKFGLDEKELFDILNDKEFSNLKNIKICGLMGMASNTENKEQIRNEFKKLYTIFNHLTNQPQTRSLEPGTISMGMSSDWKTAVEEGSTMIRVGSTIFGERDYKVLNT